MRQAEAIATAKAKSERWLIGIVGDVDAYCVIEWRAHRSMASLAQTRAKGNYTVTRAPKRYELVRAGAVIARPRSYEAALAALGAP